MCAKVLRASKGKTGKKKQVKKTYQASVDVLEEDRSGEVLFNTDDVPDYEGLFSLAQQDLIRTHLGDSEETNQFIQIVSKECVLPFLDGAFERPIRNMKIAELERLKSAILELWGALRGVHQLTWQDLQRRHEVHVSDYSLQKILEVLGNAVGRELANLGPKSKKPGRPKKVEVDWLIEELIKAYYSSFGGWPSSSPMAKRSRNFHHMVCDLLTDLRMVPPPKEEVGDQEKRIANCIKSVKVNWQKPKI